MSHKSVSQVELERTILHDGTLGHVALVLLHAEVPRFSRFGLAKTTTQLEVVAISRAAAAQ